MQVFATSGKIFESQSRNEGTVLATKARLTKLYKSHLIFSLLNCGDREVCLETGILITAFHV